jgi:hypothetical protein
MKPKVFCEVVPFSLAETYDDSDVNATSFIRAISFSVLEAGSMKMTVFWDVALKSVV